MSAGPSVLGVREYRPSTSSLRGMQTTKNPKEKPTREAHPPVGNELTPVRQSRVLGFLNPASYGSTAPSVEKRHRPRPEGHGGDLSSFGLLPSGIGHFQTPTPENVGALGFL